MQRLTIPVLSPKVYLFVKALCILGIISWSIAQPLPPPIPSPRGNSEQEQPGKGDGQHTSQEQGNPSPETTPPIKVTPRPEAADIAKQIRNKESHEATTNW